jgi:hypothetical protein
MTFISTRAAGGIIASRQLKIRAQHAAVHRNEYDDRDEAGPLLYLYSRCANDLSRLGPYTAICLLPFNQVSLPRAQDGRLVLLYYLNGARIATSRPTRVSFCSALTHYALPKER